ncbi:hypothetical protein KXR87_09070 [Yokenella regensburgei]|uniref:hypothetical protein n=1 Tax=Yokenella regensburgei TaxID=158877 RepID=UPI003F14F1E4
MEDKDFESLLRAMYPHPDDNDNQSDIDELCRLRLGVGFEDFVRVANALLPLTVPTQSPKTQSYFHSFWVDGTCYVYRESDI